MQRQTLQGPSFDLNSEGEDELIDNLTLEQSRHLREAIRQADAGETVPHEEIVKMLERWLPK